MTRKEALQTAKPILFNTEMVRAIQNGTKTVTRQVAFPNKDLHEFKHKDYPNGWWYRGRAAKSWDSILHCIELEKPCKYKIGDILYVRETWARVSEWVDIDPEVGLLDGWIYKADWSEEVEAPKWRPSIHMPKEAARIFLRVTGVRVERLQDITDEDMVRDFARCPEAVNAVGKSVGKDVLAKTVWNSTVKKSDLDKYGWAANPWVWVIEFEKVEVTV